MKQFFSGRVLFSLVAPAVMILSFASFADRPNFSGDWKLNEGKSELGEFGGRTARSIKVEQKQNDITVTRTTPGFNGGDPVTTTLVLTYDGKETESTGFGGSKRKTTAGWSADGQTLTIHNSTFFERDGQTQEFKSTETWTMKDGALSVVNVFASPRGEGTTKAMYDK